MKDIKTKETIRDIRVLDRQANLFGSIRKGYVRSKDLMRNTTDSRESTENDDLKEDFGHGGYEVGYVPGITKVRRDRKSIDYSVGIDDQLKEGIEEIPSSQGDFERKTVGRSSERKGIKTVATAERKARETADIKSFSSRRSTFMVKDAMESIKCTASSAGDSILKGVRWVIEAAEELYASLFAGGWVSVSVVAVICIIGLLTASPFGIFLSGDNSGTGKTMQAVIREINEEFLGRINTIKSVISYDDLKISGEMAMWPDVLAIYAVRTTSDPDYSLEVVTVTDEKEKLLRNIFWDMNSIIYGTENYEEQITVEPPEGDESTEEEVTETVSRTRLLISVSHKTAPEMSLEYGFSQEQNTYLDEMLSDRFRSLWSSLIGGYSAGMGIIHSEATWVGLNGFVWPLPINGTITSGYGYRSDPFTGEQKFHGGVDIAVAEGTPILAVDNGIVIAANGSDLWGGGYGYYVEIDHLNGYETLYGHCSFICMTEGQAVRKGEVIAYVGSTGNSTGDHLHFETYLYKERQDPMSIFIV